MGLHVEGMGLRKTKSLIGRGFETISKHVELTWRFSVSLWPPSAALRSGFSTTTQKTVKNRSKNRRKPREIPKNRCLLKKRKG